MDGFFVQLTPDIRTRFQYNFRTHIRAGGGALARKIGPKIAHFCGFQWSNQLIPPPPCTLGLFLVQPSVWLSKAMGSSCILIPLCRWGAQAVCACSITKCLLPLPKLWPGHASLGKSRTQQPYPDPSAFSGWIAFCPQAGQVWKDIKAFLISGIILYMIS